MFLLVGSSLEHAYKTHWKDFVCSFSGLPSKWSCISIPINPNGRGDGNGNGNINAAKVSVAKALVRKASGHDKLWRAPGQWWRQLRRRMRLCTAPWRVLKKSAGSHGEQLLTVPWSAIVRRVSRQCLISSVDFVAVEPYYPFLLLHHLLSPTSLSYSITFSLLLHHLLSPTPSPETYTKMKQALSKQTFLHYTSKAHCLGSTRRYHAHYIYNNTNEY